MIYEWNRGLAVRSSWELQKMLAQKQQYWMLRKVARPLVFDAA
jgi:hypothetical protein